MLKEAIEKTWEIFTDPEAATKEVLDGLENARLYFSESRPIKNGDSYQIRAAQIIDSDQLASLYQAAFSEYPFASLVHQSEGHTSFLEDRSQVRLLVHDQQEIVAAAAMSTIPPDLSAEIKQVVVHPKNRGERLSLPLILSLVRAAEMARLQYLYMDVRARMAPMQKTAIKAGFTAIGYRPGQHLVYHPEGARREHMINMLLTLNGAQNYLDEVENQNIDKRIIEQLAQSGVDINCLQEHHIWDKIQA